MERELKIILTIFLTYLIFGITTWFQTGSLITPIFLNKIILVCLSILFVGMNLKIPHLWILILYTFALLAYALTDDFIIGLLDRLLKSESALIFVQSDLIAVISFIIFFLFLFCSVYFFYRQTGSKIPSLLLLLILVSCLSLFFTSFQILQEILIKLFFLIYFFIGQRDYTLNNKFLRLLSYQFLGLVLLESFEYFV
jgi:hypothetical protein